MLYILQFVLLLMFLFLLMSHQALVKKFFPVARQRWLTGWHVNDIAGIAHVNVLPAHATDLIVNKYIDNNNVLKWQDHLCLKH